MELYILTAQGQLVDITNFVIGCIVVVFVLGIPFTTSAHKVGGLTFHRLGALSVSWCITRKGNK